MVGVGDVPRRITNEQDDHHEAHHHSHRTRHRHARRARNRLRQPGRARAPRRRSSEPSRKAVEADTGGDVDVEFNEDGISVESDEGDFSLSVDENGVEIDGTDADGNDFSLDADEDGINAESEDGTLDVDSDGTFTATDADGDVTTGQVSSDGDSVDFTVEGEDGDAVFTSGEGIPTEWPEHRAPSPRGSTTSSGPTSPRPATRTSIVTGTTGCQRARTPSTTTSTASPTPASTEDTKINQGTEFYSATFTKGDTTVNVTTQASGNSTDVVIAVN